MSAPRASCPNCGARTTKRAKFCAECGTPLDSAGPSDTSTAVIETPPSETGPVPVSVTAAEPRLFGVTPPMLVFALAVAALAISILLLATERRLAGGLSLAASLLLFAAFAEVARRKPDSAVARASAGAVSRARARAAYAAEAMTTRSGARRELKRLRYELDDLGADRRTLMHTLGELVYTGDKRGTKAVQAELHELDARIEAKEAEMATVVAEAEERVQRARLEVQPTEMVEVPEPSRPSPEPPIPAPDPGPPGPAPVPEPGPTPVPEPYPPPDEADPPEPARIPEPGPLGRKRKKK